jgi:ABC-2 type transport system permease protein
VSSLRSIILVARRELLERARSKVFLASSAVMVLVVVFMIVGPALFEAGSGSFTVGHVGQAPEALPELVQHQATALELEAEMRAYPSVESGEAALVDETVDALVVDGREVVWLDEVDPRLNAVLTGTLQLLDVQRRAAALDIDPEAAATLLAPAEIRTRALEPVDADLEGRRFAAMVVMVLLFIAINMYGSFVLTGVVEEKTNRVVEVLLARIPPRHLLGGKVLGIGLLGLAQVVLLAIAAVATIAVTPATDVELPRIDAGLVAWLAVWFVLGFALYSMAYGALGALASRMEDAQSAVGPLTAVLIAAYFLTFSVIMHDEAGALAVGIGLFPLTAPMAMPMRLAVGAVAPWEVVASLVLMAGAVYGLMHLAGRVYSGAVLRTGGKVKLRDAWRSAAPPVT